VRFSVLALEDWVGSIAMPCARTGSSSMSAGASSYDVLDVRGTLHVVRQPSPWSLTATFGERLKDVLVSFLPGK
jgi:hypothetical protein